MRRGNNANLLVKNCIVSALIDLMKKTEYDRITITDITQKAGVSRMAYYRNYSSKDDILIKYLDEIGDQIHDEMMNFSGRNKMRTYFAKMFELIGLHSDLGVAVIKANLSELIIRAIDKKMAESFAIDVNDAEEVYHLRALSGAFTNMFITWIRGGRVESPDQMSQLFCEMFDYYAVRTLYHGV